MIQERHKLLERTLEVDVVFPERVVGIDDQVLAVHCFGRGARWNGISKMASTSTATPSRSAGVNSHFANASRALRSSRSSSWRSNAIPPTCPSLPITPNSLHQHPFYPGTGAAGDRGGPEASGLTVNVPLPGGTTAEQWLAAFDAAVVPALHDFAPELVVVSCGFDAHRDDPLAELLLDTQTYAAVAERLAAMTDLPSRGRSAWVLEGGYDLDALTASTQAVLDVLLAA